jgi:uncharacterized protein YoxC
MARIAKVASETEEQARARWAAATQEVSGVDREREGALQRAGQLANEEMPLKLRSHLTGAGARHLISLTDQKVELAQHVDECQAELQEAVTKVKSLERVVERLDDAARERQRLQEVADLQDLVSIRAVRDQA